MAVIFSDNFSAALNATNWTDERGSTWSTSAGSVVRSLGAGVLSPLTTKVAAHAAIADCQVTFTRQSATCDGGPYVRVTGAPNSNGYYADIVAGSGTVNLYRRVSAVDTLVGTWSTTNASGDTYGLKVQGVGATVTLTFYKNGTAIGSPILDSNAARIVVAGQTGIFAWDALTADDFIVDDTASALVLEQEGFRWRNDDGSEATATWKAAQDTNVTVVPDAITRLRMLVNATGDPASARYKLQYRKVGAAAWRDMDKFV